MSLITIPYTFSAGTNAVASEVNANYTVLANVINGGLDSTNVGAAGFYASQIIPTSSAQALFGGSVGYKFYPGASGVVPLTISGVAGQSVDILDITLTSGGTNAFKLNSAGAATFGTSVAIGTTLTAGTTITSTAGNIIALAGTLEVTALGAVSLPGGVGTGDLLAQQTASRGALFLGGSTQSSALDFGVSTANAWTFQSRPVFFKSDVSGLGTFLGITASAAVSIPASAAAGDICAQRSSSTGNLILGGSVTNYGLDGGVNSGGNLSVNKAGSTIGNFNGTTGAYTATSDVRLKENIQPLPSALTVVLALKPSSFSWKADGQADVGFIAQEVQAVIPDAVRVVQDSHNELGEVLGVNYQALTAHLVKAIQELQSEVAALREARP